MVKAGLIDCRWESDSRIAGIHPANNAALQSDRGRARALDKLGLGPVPAQRRQAPAASRLQAIEEHPVAFFGGKHLHRARVPVLEPSLQFRHDVCNAARASPRATQRLADAARAPREAREVERLGEIPEIGLRSGNPGLLESFETSRRLSPG
jgi:hypothetical protein